MPDPPQQLQILIVEDHYPHYRELESELKDRFPHASVYRIATELEFQTRFADLAAIVPDIVLLDVGLRWCDTDSVSVAPPPPGDYRRAGIRIATWLSQDPRTKDIPVVLYSNLHPDDFRAEIPKLENLYLPRETNPAVITKQVGSIISASPKMSVLERGDHPERVRNKIFISYSSLDRRWLERLKDVMQPFIRNRVFEAWDDSQLTDGPWRPQLERHMDTAAMALFLVSLDFLASSFINDHELPRLLKAYQQNGVKIAWIAVTDSAYDHTVLADFHCLNSPKHPLQRLPKAKQEQTLVEIARRIADLLEPRTP